MKYLWDSALGLLVVTGGLLGLTLPFGKLATAAGVPAMVWAFVISLGAGGVLLGVLLARGQRIRLTPHKLRYFFVTAAVSYAVPNLLMFSAIPHLGAGYTGIMFTLSPVITLVFSILLGVRRPNMLGVSGIAVGFVGAVMVAVTRGEAGQPADLFWVVTGLLIPVSLAAGNIYRTIDWPEGTGPIELAVGSHLASAAMLLVGILTLLGGKASSSLAPCRSSSWRRWPRHRRCLLSSSGCRRLAVRSISARSAMSRQRSDCLPARSSLVNTINC